MKLKTKPIPIRIARRIRYDRKRGCYRILRPDGTYEMGGYYSKRGAASMLLGTCQSHAFDP